MKDRLFLLKPGFLKGTEGPYYCGDSVPVEGLLSYFPQLRNLVDVQYVDFQKPRRPIADLLGETHQSAPVIVLADDVRLMNRGIAYQEVNGHRFIADERLIRTYLATQYGLPTAG